MKVKIYDIAKMCGTVAFSEINALIVGAEKFILTDNEAVHTVHTHEEGVGLGTKTFSLKDIQAEVAVDEVELGEYIRSFGRRIETNWYLLLDSLKEIGLDPKDFPRKEKE